jgi:hypothetical protein
MLGSVTPGIGTIQSDRLQTGSVTPNKLAIMAVGKNLFNLQISQAGNYINGLQQAQLAANASYQGIKFYTCASVQQPTQERINIKWHISI